VKSWAAFSITMLLLTAALIWSQVKKPEAPVGPQPIVNLIADSEHELMRLPVAFAPLSDSEEIRIGKELEQEYASLLQAPSEENRAQENYVENYVQKVGARVAAHAHRKLPYRFHYIPGLSFVNAFALPGGGVFIGGGLMSLMTSEDALAAVLGHEIEHIDHYHCAERVQIEAALRRVPLGELVGIPVEIFVAGYSKSQELEADREGTKLAAAAGYSPQGAIELFEAFARFEPEKRARTGTPAEEITGIAGDALDGYFRSHPPSAERIDEIRRLIADGELPDRRNTTPLAVAH
jgi:predicted Zn-dependent protease